MRFATVRKYALSLPEVTEQPHHECGSFRVRGRIFVTAPPDGGHIHVFIPEQHRDPALAVYSAFVEKLLWGGKAVGVRVTLANAEARAVKRLVRLAWQAKAPRALRAADEPSAPAFMGAPGRWRTGASSHPTRASKRRLPAGEVQRRGKS
jgi:hypothetical protein